MEQFCEFSFFLGALSVIAIEIAIFTIALGYFEIKKRNEKKGEE